MSNSRAYWVVVFTVKTWEEALAAGGNIVGFRSGTRGNFDKIAVGDYLLCYLTGVSRFVAVLEVESEPFLDDTPVWKDDVFPYRVVAKAIVQLEPEKAVPGTWNSPTDSRYSINIRLLGVGESSSEPRQESGIKKMDR